MCQRPRILTCDWTKPWNWSEPLYTQRLGQFGAINVFIPKDMIWHGPKLNWVHQKWEANSWPRGQCQILILKKLFYDFFLSTNQIRWMLCNRPLGVIASLNILALFSLFSNFYWIGPASWPKGLYIWENWPPL